MESIRLARADPQVQVDLRRCGDAHRLKDQRPRTPGAVKAPALFPLHVFRSIRLQICSFLLRRYGSADDAKEDTLSGGERQ
jgi:hypothetical protein